MSRRRWARQLRLDVQPLIDRGDTVVRIDVPARRAGVARRRLHAIAAWLEPHGYVLRTVDPTRRPAVGVWSVAEFVRAED